MTIEGWTIQDIQLELIKRSSFNGFDGEMVEASLVGNQDLWQGVIMDRAGYSFSNGAAVDLIKLRDIKHDVWNVDTIFILAVLGKEDLLWDLVETWNADEVSWFDEKEAGRMLGSFGSKYSLLRVWWD